MPVHEKKGITSRDKGETRLEVEPFPNRTSLHSSADRGQTRSSHSQSRASRISQVHPREGRKVKAKWDSVPGGVRHCDRDKGT